MTTKIISALRLTAILGLAAVAAPAAKAIELNMANVYPSDTFSIDIIGYNQANPNQAINLIPVDFQTTFGTTTTTTYTLTGVGAQNQTITQNLTVSSAEYIYNGQYNDYITVSVPTNFVPSGTVDKGGNPLDAISFSIGNYLGGTNTLDLNTALADYQTAGTVSFINQGSPASAPADTVTTKLTNGNTSFSAVAVVDAVNDISNNQVKEVAILLTYAVPEPSTYAAVALGTFGMLLVVRRRRRTQA